LVHTADFTGILSMAGITVTTTVRTADTIMTGIPVRTMIGTMAMAVRTTTER
jgi:hypothetical protein